MWHYGTAVSSDGKTMNTYVVVPHTMNNGFSLIPVLLVYWSITIASTKRFYQHTRYCIVRYQAPGSLSWYCRYYEYCKSDNKSAIISVQIFHLTCRVIYLNCQEKRILEPFLIFGLSTVECTQDRATQSWVAITPLYHHTWHHAILVPTNKALVTMPLALLVILRMSSGVNDKKRKRNHTRHGGGLDFLSGIKQNVFLFQFVFIWL